jgi:hypothetical protein
MEATREEQGRSTHDTRRNRSEQTDRIGAGDPSCSSDDGGSVPPQEREGTSRRWLAGWLVTLVRAPLMPLSSLLWLIPSRVLGWGTVAGGLVSDGEAGVTRGKGQEKALRLWLGLSGRGQRKRGRGGACILFLMFFSGSIDGGGEGDVRPRKQRRCLSLFACSCVDAVHASRSHTRWAPETFSTGTKRCSVELVHSAFALVVRVGGMRAGAGSQPLGTSDGISPPCRVDGRTDAGELRFRFPFRGW